jgi:SAM-dependent methyltransferase
VASERRLTFGSVAELYDRARPSYPEALVGDVLEFAGAGESDRALEVGAGTGKATVLFARRGLAVTALEPSHEMAAVARDNCAAYPNVTIEETDFERWQGAGHEFRLIFSAQAWHWVAPDVRYVAARAALEEGGALAAFWNVPDWGTSDLREELGEAYRRSGRADDADDPMNPAAPPDDANWWPAEIADTPGFDGAEVRDYPWRADHTTAQYLELLGTHSAFLILDQAQQHRVVTEIAGAIDAAGGAFRMSYVTRLCLARAS